MNPKCKPVAFATRALRWEPYLASFAWTIINENAAELGDDAASMIVAALTVVPAPTIPPGEASPS